MGMEASEFQLKTVGGRVWAAQQEGVRHFVTPAQVRVAQSRSRCTAICGQPLEASGLLRPEGAKQVCTGCVAVITPNGEVKHGDAQSRRE
jgi:hypothetical protein